MQFGVFGCDIGLGCGDLCLCIVQCVFYGWVGQFYQDGIGFYCGIWLDQDLFYLCCCCGGQLVGGVWYQGVSGVYFVQYLFLLYCVDLQVGVFGYWQGGFEMYQQYYYVYQYGGVVGD